MKEFLAQKFSHFEINDFSPRGSLGGAFTTFFSWALPALLFVLWAETYHPEVDFYKAAIREGLGPNLWNALGSLGIFAFGIAVVFSTLHTPAKIAKQILSNTYAIGCLTFGLLVGHWYLLPTDDLLWWQRGLFGAISGFFLILLFIYNFSVWYLGFLILDASGNKSSFLLKLEEMHWIWKISIGLVVSVLITLIFLTVI